MKRLPFVRPAAVLLIAAAALVSCYKNPSTGRKELMLMSRQEEAQLGFEAFNSIKQETPRSSDANVNSQVDRVGRRIASSVNLPYAEWEFVAFQSKDVNAFCLPGGKVGVYTAILPITQDDNGLATVLGHEVAHAEARHGGERMSQALLVQLGGVGLAVAMRDKPQQTQELAMSAYGLGATVGYILPFSRKQESEADYMGLIFMARSGYDPRQAIPFWQRFKAWGDQQGGQPPEFLSTHPLSSTRIKNLRKHMNEAVDVYEGRSNH